MYIGNIGELFSYCLTEGTFVLLFSDVSTLTLAPSVPLRRSQPSMKLFSSLKVMTARNEGDGNQNTHVQITPAQGCELATAGLISSDSYPNKHRKAFQNLFFFFFFNGDNQEENTGQTVSHDSRQLSVKQTRQSRLYWCLEPQDGKGNKQGRQSTTTTIWCLTAPFTVWAH